MKTGKTQHMDYVHSTINDEEELIQKIKELYRFELWMKHRCNNKKIPSPNEVSKLHLMRGNYFIFTFPR